jgi:murein DD-endopeptidase MepM/ murein hydrolase activator NlpD
MTHAFTRARKLAVALTAAVATSAIVAPAAHAKPEDPDSGEKTEQVAPPAPAPPTPQQTALDAASADLLAAQMQATTAKAELADAQKAVEENKAALAAAQLQSQQSREIEAQATIELTTAGYKTQESLYALETLVRSSYLNASSSSMPAWAWVVLGKGEDLANQTIVDKAEANATNSTTNDYVDRSEDSKLSERLAAKAGQAREDRQAAEAETAARLAAAEQLGNNVAAVSERAAQLEATQAARVVEAQKLVDADRRRVERLAREADNIASDLHDAVNNLPEAQRKLLEAAIGGMVRPGTGTITSPFGMRFHPILKYTKLHTGTDFSVADGNAYAAASGVVLSSAKNPAYGNLVTIGHGKLNGKNIETWYAHLAVSNVKAGDVVQRGQSIGKIGSTGYSTGPHLHFEVRVDGTPEDPMIYLAGAPSPVAVKP